MVLHNCKHVFQDTHTILQMSHYITIPYCLFDKNERQQRGHHSFITFTLAEFM